jgi:hypothetical protein
LKNSFALTRVIPQLPNCIDKMNDEEEEGNKKKKPTNTSL